MKMKKLLFFVLFPLAIYSLSSCSKSTDPTIATALRQAADDDAAIKAYLIAHPEITNVKDTLVSNLLNLSQKWQELSSYSV